MSIRYTFDELKYLRGSPLVVKPPGLPPTEQWMGLLIDSSRNTTEPDTDKAKKYDSNELLDQTNRRPVAEKNLSRNSANTEDIILGPPKTSFLSATSVRNTGKNFESTERTGVRDAAFSFRGKAGEGENDRSREARNNSLRPRCIEGDQDNDGWSTVKPRKSFGTEGAERFNGRMGIDRHREDKVFNKDYEDRDRRDRPRGFDSFLRDKDGEHKQERDYRRNGIGRGRTEPSWFKDRENHEVPPTPRDRHSNGDRHVDRSRGWRGKEREDRVEKEVERGTDRESDRGDRRWDRDRELRHEREPEWMDEPLEDKGQTHHTSADFEKWKEEMQGRDKMGKSPMENTQPDAGTSFFGSDNSKAEIPLEFDSGPDKFFSLFTSKEEHGSDSKLEPKNEGFPKSKTIGKASRFTSFFTAQDEPPQRSTTEPPLVASQNLTSDTFLKKNTQSIAEKEAFQQLLKKLQRQTIGASESTPPVHVSLQPKLPGPEKTPISNMHSTELYQQHRKERQDESRPATQNSQQALQDLLIQRQIAGTQTPIKPEQMLQELVGQRQNALSRSSTRPDQQPPRNTNTEFLMGLMQSAKAAPDPQRTEQILLRMPPKLGNRLAQQHLIDREQEMQREAAVQRERSASQRQTRPQPPPGFFDDPSFQRGPISQHERLSGTQPTQILQRPPPPGLDMGWDRQAQLPPPQHRLAQNIAPPPGLANGHNRGMPIPQQMLPPGFPVGNFPPPDIMNGPPRGIQMQPPPGFFNAPPPGFLPPGIGTYQGPEVMGFGATFDSRGPPPQGTFRRP